MGRSFAIDTRAENSKEFVCDDDYNSGTSFLNFVKNRFDESTPPKDIIREDDVDAESLCATTKKTITPKTLPSVIDSKLVTVVNHGEFTQTVTIEECS